VIFTGKVGNDQAGEQLMKELKEQGVETQEI